MTSTQQMSPAVAFDVRVVAVVPLSPTYLRVTFGGPSLARFHTGGPLGTRDLRVKLIIPSPGGQLPDLADMSNGWYQRWLALPLAARGSMRTYTAREVRAGDPEPELDIDFVIHLDESGHGGPATSWAAAAQVGDPLTIIGPNARAENYGGIEWQPPATSPQRRLEVLLVGDETAVPAISSILDSLPEHCHGHAVLEVPRADDFQMPRTEADVDVRWLARGSVPRGRLLDDVARTIMAESSAAAEVSTGTLREVDVDHEILWETPDQALTGTAFYAWIAGEAGTVRDLRRYLVRELGIDRKSVAFMGYWRQGRAEAG